MIIDKIIVEAAPLAGNKTIKDIRIGLGYTAVMLDDGFCGLAATSRSELGLCCTSLENAGDLIGSPCSDIITWASDIHLVKAAIGTAAINALLQGKIVNFETGNLFDMVDISAQDKLGVIGNFKPIIEGKGANAKKIYIFEREAVRGENIYPDYAIDVYLPQCDIVIITATAIINKTIDHIIEKCSNARCIAIVGPSTPLCPKIFKEFGVDLIAGVKVCNPHRILDIVSQSGGTRCFKKDVEQVYFTL